MKTTKIITMVCWIISAIALTGLALWFLTGTLFGIRTGSWGNNMNCGANFGNIGNWEVLTGPFNQVGSQSIDVSGIDSINIDWVAGEVTAKPYDGNTIQISEFAQRELRDNEKFHIDTSGDTLTIRFREQRNFVTNIPQKRLEVLVPQALSESLGKLKIDNTSGSVNVDGFNVSTLEIASLSGRVDFKNITAYSIDTKSTSGSITATSVSAGELKLESLSGAISVTGSAAGRLGAESTSGSLNISGEFGDAELKSLSGRITLNNSFDNSVLDAESTSGSLELHGSFRNIKAETLSGSITINSMIVPAKLNAESTSGSITISVPDEGAIPVYHSSISGRFSSDIAVILDNKGAQFEISTLSGNVRILAPG